VTGILAQEYPESQAAYPADDLERLAAIYGGPGEAFLIAEADGQVIGTCGVKAEGRTTALLRRLFVHAAYRGRGVGSRLIDAAITHCRAQGYRQVRIRTSDRMTSAIAVCVHKGFQEAERFRLGTAQLVHLMLRV